MYAAVVQGATFPGVLAGYGVQKIFYLVIGTLIYVYLFSAVAGSFDYQFGNEWDSVSGHPVLVLGIAAGAIFLVAILLRLFWPWVKKMWAKAKPGAAILSDLGAYVEFVLLPQMGGYAAKVMVIVVFLAAYGIPVTFGSVMSVLGSNQLANILSFTPGGIGVNQAFNSFALGAYTNDTTATAYRWPAAHHDGLQRRLRNPAHLLRLRLAGWLEARQGLVRRRQGQEGRDER